MKKVCLLHTLLLMLFILCNFRDQYPMLLVANKIDLVRQRKVTEDQGRSLAAQLRVSTLQLDISCLV